MKASAKLFFVLLFSVMATTLFAQSAPRTDARQANQRARMAQGRASGEITAGEAAALRANQRHVRRVERRAEADGVVTPAEQATLDRKQNRASRRIYRAKHNAVER